MKLHLNKLIVDIKIDPSPAPANTASTSEGACGRARTSVFRTRRSRLRFGSNSTRSPNSARAKALRVSAPSSAVAESLQPFDTRADLTPQTGQRAVLTPHHVVAQRAQASIGRLDERLAQAKADGLMTFFNSQYISSPRFSISPCPAPSGFTTTPMSSFTGSPSSMERLCAIRTRLRE